MKIITLLLVRLKGGYFRSDRMDTINAPNVSMIKSDSNTVIGITSLPLQERKRATTHESLITLFSLYHIRTYVSIALYTLKKKCTSSEPIWVNHSILTLSSRFSGNNKLNTTPKIKAMKKVVNLALIMSSNGELIHIKVPTSPDKTVAITPIPE